MFLGLFALNFEFIESNLAVDKSNFKILTIFKKHLPLIKVELPILKSHIFHKDNFINDERI